jgi:UDP-N-acetyl-D-glucosamine dehydrogenase
MEQPGVSRSPLLRNRSLAAVGGPPLVARGETDMLEHRLRHRTARVAVIGLGYVGLPLIRVAVEAGFSGLGLDIDQRKVEILNGGRSYIRHIPDESVAALRASGRFEASAEFTRVAEADVALICVPTPLTQHREPDLGFVVKTVEALAPHLRPGQLIVLESTTYPGTTLEVVKPILEGTGLRSGIELFLAYSPEREDPGNIDHSATTTPKIVGGDGETARRLASIFYDQFVTRTVSVSSTAVAEAVKLTENIFRAVNIALVNELKVVFEAMDINIWEVIEAAKTKPFGYMPFYPGPGLGGHCIPIDPFYLTWKAREYNITTRFIELAGEVNAAMPRYVVERLALALDVRAAKGLNGARILIMGLAYKKNIDDIRESPSLTIMALLERRGAVVAYHDPFLSVIPPSRQHRNFAGRRSITLGPAVIAAFDAVLIVTDHDCIDYGALVAAAHLVVDTRNATRKVTQHRDRIVRA